MATHFYPQQETDLSGAPQFVGYQPSAPPPGYYAPQPGYVQPASPGPGTTHVSNTVKLQGVQSCTDPSFKCFCDTVCSDCL